MIRRQRARWIMVFSCALMALEAALHDAAVIGAAVFLFALGFLEEAER